MITLVEIDGNVQGNSSSSLSIGTGSKTFTLASSQPFIAGMTVTAKYDASNDMTGTITRVSGTTLVVNVSSVNGSGTYATWVINGERTIYLGTETYVSRTTDTPANQEYLGVIIDPGNISQYMFGVAKTLGESKVDTGDIVCSNKQGELDYVKQMGFSKGGLRIKVVSGQNQPLPLTNVFAGTIIYPDVGLKQVVFTAADRLAELDVPAQTVTFDGSNSGATGIEGSEGGIKGQVKPFGLGGPQFNVTPKFLNESSRIYGLSFDVDGATEACTAITDVLDEGLAKTLDTGVGTSGDVANLAALQAATITAGQYATCLAESLFRISGAANGTITANYTQNSKTGAAIVKALLEDRLGYTTSDYVSSSFTAVDALNNDAQELYVTDDSTVFDLANSVMNGMGGYIISNLENKFEVGLLTDPSAGSSVYMFDKWTILDLKTVISRDPGDGLPPKQLKLNYKRNYTPLADSEFAGGVSETDRLLYKSEWKESVGSINSNIETKHPTAPIFVINTHFTTETDANTERTRQETLRQVERHFYEFSTGDLEPLNLGDIITLEFDRLGLQSGKKVVILGKEIDFRKSRIGYLVWG